MGRISFQKRQKEMKRQEKRQMNAEKRAQRKLAKNGEGVAEPELTAETLETTDSETTDSQAAVSTTEPIGRS
jgi:hypothetical protein